MNPTSLRAVLVARVSTPKQAEKYSLDRQLAVERAYCAEIGAEIVAEFQDDVTGRKLAREGLSAAREMLAENKADILVVFKWDRLHRNYVDSVLLRDELRRQGKELHYAQLKAKSGGTARERLPEDLNYILAEIEAEDIAERTSNGRLGKATGKDGVPPRWLAQGRPPYGYRKVGTGGSAYLELDERTAPIVRWIYEKYVGGWSTREIAEELTRNGYQTPTEYAAHKGARRKRPAGEWSPSTVVKIIRHTAYSGKYYQLAVETKEGHKRRRPKSETLPCEVRPIVDLALWQAAQEKMDKGRKESRRRTKHNYLLARRIACSCGHAMRSAVAGSIKRKGVTDRPTQHFYYRCTAAVKDGWVVGDCNSRGIRAQDADDIVWEALRNELLDSAALERKLRDLQAKQGNVQAERDLRLRALYAEKVLVEDEISSHLDAKARKLAPPHIIERKLQEATHRLGALEERIASEEATSAEGVTDERITTILGLSRALEGRLEEEEKTFEGRRTILELLNVQITATWVSDTETRLAIDSDLYEEPMMRFVNRLPSRTAGAAASRTIFAPGLRR